MLKLREIRKEKGLTQQNIAEILNIQDSAVSKIELHKTTLNSNQIIELCKFLNVRSDDLLGLGEEKKKGL